MFFEKRYGSLPGFICLCLIVTGRRIVMEAVTGPLIGVHDEIFPVFFQGTAVGFL